ncbi:prepilin peptidase [Corynebacterium sp. S7]
MGGPLLGPLLGLGGALLWSVALVIYDLRERRLPNWLTLPAGIVAIVWAVAVSPAALAGLVWPLLYLIVALLQGGVGGGDIKLALPLGIIVAAASGVVGVCAAIVLASATTVIAAKATGKPSVPNGPGMLLGTWVVVVAGLAFMHYTS